MIVLFPEGTSGDGRSVLPFRSSYFAAVHDPGNSGDPGDPGLYATLGPAAAAARAAAYAWYGDMDLPPHLWNAVAEGPLTVEVIFHPAETLHHAKDRKTPSAHAEQTIREGLVHALHGRGKRGYSPGMNDMSGLAPAAGNGEGGHGAEERSSSRPMAAR